MLEKVFRKIRKLIRNALYKEKSAIYKNVAGQGTFRFKEQVSFNNNFSFTVDLFKSDRNKGLIITTFTGIEARKEYRDLPFYPWTLEGIITDGRKLSAKGLSLISVEEGFNGKDAHRTLEFSFSELEIGEIDEFSHVEFYNLNFKIGFDKFDNKKGTAVRNTSIIELEVDGYPWIIEFKEISKSKGLEIEDNNISNQHIVKIKLKKKDGNVCFADSKDLVEKVLDLCSIAYGDRVTWSYAIGFHNEVERFRIIRDVPLCKLKPFRQLIRVEYPGRISNYITTCFPGYSALSEQQRKILNKLIDGIHFSADRLNFPAPITSLGSSIEDFANGILADLDSHYIGKLERRQLLPSFSDWVDQQVIPLLNNQEDIEDFGESGKKQKLSGIMQRNLMSRITNLLHHFNILFEVDWVRSFVQKRNSAAHGTYQFSNEDYDTWSRMAALLEKCILIEVKYNGEYLDWLTSPPEWREL